MVREASAACAEAVLQLRQDSPRSLALAASLLAQAHADTAGFAAAAARGHSLYQRGLALARQQGSEFWVAFVALNWVTFAANNQLFGSLEGLEAVLEAYPEAAAAVKRIKHALPDTWVRPLAGVVAVARQQLLPSVQAQVDYLRRGGSGTLTAAERRTALRTLQAAHSTAGRAQVSPKSTCDACAQNAAGLRMCSRCKLASYCSRECQVAHWKEHKRVCQPAASS